MATVLIITVVGTQAVTQTGRRVVITATVAMVSHPVTTVQVTVVTGARAKTAVLARTHVITRVHAQPTIAHGQRIRIHGQVATTIVHVRANHQPLVQVTTVVGTRTTTASDQMQLAVADAEAAVVGNNNMVKSIKSGTSVTNGSNKQLRQRQHQPVRIGRYQKS